MDHIKTLHTVNCSGCRGQGWFRSSTSGLLTKCPKCRGLGFFTNKQDDLFVVFTNKKENLNKQSKIRKAVKRNLNKFFLYCYLASKVFLRKQLETKSDDQES